MTCLKMYFGISTGRCGTKKFCRVDVHFFLFLTNLKHKKCDEAVACSTRMLRHVPDHFKTQEICDKAVEKIHRGCNTSLITLRHKRCVEKQLKKCHGWWKLSMISIRRRRCVLGRLRNPHAP